MVAHRLTISTEIVHSIPTTARYVFNAIIFHFYILGIHRISLI
jgi:hypothetical protein